MTRDRTDFEIAVAPHRAALHAYCYRMLGSLHDADDALQETLVAAWRGIDGFEGRSTLRTWLYTIATNACRRLIAKRPSRRLPADAGPPTDGMEHAPMTEAFHWLEPYPTPADATYETLESVELAFVATLQYLPATQRAVLILRDVLGFSAEECAMQLGTSVASVNSALQRAREAIARRTPRESQQAVRRRLGVEAERELVMKLVGAWERGDAAALVGLLAKDAKFTMPPIPTWFLGRHAIGRFLAERVFAYTWRAEPTRANGQLAFILRQSPDFGVGALNVVTLEGSEIAEMTGFLHPDLHARFLMQDR